MEVCDYLLYQYNIRKMFDYVDITGCGHPTNNIEWALTVWATRKGWTRHGSLDMQETCKKWLNLYRKGELPTFVIDDLNFANLREEEKAAQHPVQIEDGNKSDFAKEYS